MGRLFEGSVLQFAIGTIVTWLMAMAFVFVFFGRSAINEWSALGALASPAIWLLSRLVRSSGNAADLTYPSSTIPRSPSEYAQEPFDPNLTFKVDGRTTRHVGTPLDEEYVTEPVDSFQVGSLPPEEREVRDHLIAAVLLRDRVSALDFLCSQFFGETESYRVSRQAFAKLEALCSRSREHRAAFLRMANGAMLPKHVRAELKRMVERADARGL